MRWRGVAKKDHQRLLHSHLRNQLHNHNHWLNNQNKTNLIKNKNWSRI